MDDIPLAWLAGTLFLLILVSGFCSGSETGMMALNRYRLRHRARKGERNAKQVAALLERPDRLLGLILLTNTLANLLAASLTTIIGIRLLGASGAILAPLILVVVILIFAEVAPKTVAARYPEQIAYAAARPLRTLIWLLQPAVWLINCITNGMLRIFGFRVQGPIDAALDPEELRAVVHEASPLIGDHHKDMLLNILALDQAVVEDVMVPRNEVATVDLNASDEELLHTLHQGRYALLPVCKDTLDQVVGMLHTRRLAEWEADASRPLRESLEELLEESCYVPEGLGLHRQLLNFQRSRERAGLVVDEYGRVLGLITLEDILKEIIGEFTTAAQPYGIEIQQQSDGSFLIDGTANIREVNRQLDWVLPAEEAHTINGLILERLEHIPKSGTSLRVDRYAIEITQATGNTVKRVKISCLGAAGET